MRHSRKEHEYLARASSRADALYHSKRGDRFAKRSSASVIQIFDVTHYITAAVCGLIMVNRDVSFSHTSTAVSQGGRAP